MAHHSLVMRRRIAELLISAPCQRIDFRWGAEHVMGAQYSALAMSLNGSSPHRLQEEIGHVEGGLARYIIGRNTIRVPMEGFGVGQSEYAAYERMSIVHECTHAVFDMARRHPTTNALSNEIMAYIGGALFNLNAGRPYHNQSDQLWVIADRIAAGIPPAGGVIGPEADVLALRNAILADPTYAHLRHNPRLRWHNDGVAL